MAYSIDLKPETSKKLNSFDKEMHRRILKAIISLADNPRPSGCTMLKVEKRYRIRVGDFRVVYEIHDSRLLVLVVRIGCRSSDTPPITNTTGLADSIIRTFRKG